MDNLLELLGKVDVNFLELELARKKFEKFMVHTTPGFQVNWHHRKECEIIDQFVAKKIKKLMIFQPPQTGKSQLGSRGLPAYVLGKRPDTRIAVCSYSAHLAESFNRACQMYIDSEAYQQLFPETRLYGGSGFSQENKALRNSEIFGIVNHRGYFKSVGVTGPLTGTSVDLGIIDDPFKDRIEANSQRMRDRVWDWYVEVFSTRMDNDAQELLMMTRWHEDDLAGRLLKQDAERVKEGLEPEWTVITFPGLKVGPPNEFDPREEGEALWPEKHSAARYELQKKKAPSAFQALYQQNPTTPGGNIIKPAEFIEISYAEFLQKIGKHKPVWDYIIDPAYGTKTSNDPSAIMSYCEFENCMFIRDVQSVRLEFPDLCDYIPKFMAKYSSRKSVLEIEPKASGKSIVPAVKRATKLNVKEYKFPKVDGTRLDDKDKVTRANVITEDIEVGRIYVITGSYLPGFKKQCEDFPNATHDDEVDCLVMAALKIFYRKRKKAVTTRG
jgi:predicted phage terminase large subunit-like protein